MRHSSPPVSLLFPYTTLFRSLRLDVEYVDRVSFGLDLRIVVATIGLLVRGSGISAEGHATVRSEEHTSELQSQSNLVCRLLLENKNCNLTYGSLFLLSCI